MKMLCAMCACVCVCPAIRRRRTELLQACIKRKKIAFDQFKTWYWETLDGNVQVLVRHTHTHTHTHTEGGHPTVRARQTLSRYRRICLYVYVCMCVSAYSTGHHCCHV